MSLKTGLLYIYFFLLWLYPMININSEKSLFIYAVMFIAACACFVLVRQSVIGFILGIILLSSAVFADFDNLFIIIPLLPLLFAYIGLNKSISNTAMSISKEMNKSKNKTKNSFFISRIPLFYTGIALSYILCVCCLVHCFFNSEKNIHSVHNIDYTLYHGLMALLCIFLIFCFSMVIFRDDIAEYIRKNGYPKKSLHLLKIMHITALLCFVITVCYYIFKKAFFYGYERAVLLPWVVYIATCIYFRDPVFFIFIEKIKKLSFKRK